MSVRRLFLFAGYDAGGRIDAAECMYVNALAGFGDVVYVMDADSCASQINKIKKIPNVIYAYAARHGEYDFGSYKRAYIHARDAGILRNYDIIYMVNNSVYGPLFDMADIISRMEDLNVPVFGPSIHHSHGRENIESWFIGLRRGVFTKKWFDEFMTSIGPEVNKGAVIQKYELGLSRMVAAHGVKFAGLYKCNGRSVYNRVRYLFRAGMPFMKRVAFIRHNGALGRQVKYIMDNVDAATRDAVMDNARRVYGADVVARNLTSNPIKIMWRNIVYVANKLKRGQV